VGVGEKEAEAEGSWVRGQAGLHNETLTQTRAKPKTK
jgi:hypothetical protein